MHHPRVRKACTMAFVISVVEHWLDQEIAQWIVHGPLDHTLAAKIYGDSNTSCCSRDVTIVP